MRRIRIMSQPGAFMQFAISAVITCIILIPAPAASARQGGEDPHVALCDSGFVRLGNDDIEGARRFFEEVLRRDPRYPRALLGMGRVMFGIRTGGSRAVEYLIQATEALPLDISAHYYRALAHLRLAERDVGRDNIRMARSELNSVLDLDPSHPDARYRLGIVLRDYYEEYQIAPAVRVLTKAIKKKLGADKGNSKYLYELYPYGPAKQACKIAGLPKPTGCI